MQSFFITPDHQEELNPHILCKRQDRHWYVKFGDYASGAGTADGLGNYEAMEFPTVEEARTFIGNNPKICPVGACTVIVNGDEDGEFDGPDWVWV